MSPFLFFVLLLSNVFELLFTFFFLLHSSFSFTRQGPWAYSLQLAYLIGLWSGYLMVCILSPVAGLYRLGILSLAICFLYSSDYPSSLSSIPLPEIPYLPIPHPTPSKYMKYPVPRLSDDAVPKVSSRESTAKVSSRVFLFLRCPFVEFLCILYIMTGRYFFK